MQFKIRGPFTFAWEQRKLSEIAGKVTEKNTGLQYVETLTNSAEFGIISQRDFFDHDISKLGSLDGYYIVRNEDFVYNPRISTSAPVGPINRNKLGRTGVMSPLYTVFRPHDIDTTYLEHFFKCGYWYSFMNFNGDSGARSDRFSIKDDVFFQMPIPVPHPCRTRLCSRPQVPIFTGNCRLPQGLVPADENPCRAAGGNRQADAP